MGVLSLCRCMGAKAHECALLLDSSMLGEISLNARLAVPEARRPDCPAKVDEGYMGLHAAIFKAMRRCMPGSGSRHLERQQPAYLANATIICPILQWQIEAAYPVRLLSEFGRARYTSGVSAKPNSRSWPKAEWRLSGQGSWKSAIGSGWDVAARSRKADPRGCSPSSKRGLARLRWNSAPAAGCNSRL